MLRNKQQGFTLIELIMVIVILGILAATALPKFASMGADARLSVLKGGLGSVNSAIAIAHAQALIKGQTGATGTVDLEGSTVNLVYGYPKKSTDGIDLAVNVTGDLSIASGVLTISGVADATKCTTTYTQATASAPASAALVASPDCS